MKIVVMKAKGFWRSILKIAFNIKNHDKKD